MTIDNQFNSYKGFGSDNHSGVHPKVFEYLQQVNQNHTPAYGYDTVTEKAQMIFKEHFGPESQAHFVLSGTGANVIALQIALQPFQGVICTEDAHINVHECGAIERFAGAKLLTVPSPNGKLTVDMIQSKLGIMGDEHCVQPKMISISQVTEHGTVYTIEELKALVSFAHKNNLYVHIDGARFANATVSLNTNFKAMSTDLGIDIISFGGTKNGLMCAETVVILNPELQTNAKFIRKQAMQLASKMRFVSAQYLAYFDNNLWFENAKHANEMASYLGNELQKISGIEIIHPIDANLIFAKMPVEIIKPLQQQFHFYEFDPLKHIARFVTSFDTKKDEIDQLISQIN